MKINIKLLVVTVNVYVILRPRIALSRPSHNNITHFEILKSTITKHQVYTIADTQPPNERAFSESKNIISIYYIVCKSHSIRLCESANVSFLLFYS